MVQRDADRIAAFTSALADYWGHLGHPDDLHSFSDEPSSFRDPQFQTAATEYVLSGTGADRVAQSPMNDDMAYVATIDEIWRFGAPGSDIDEIAGRLSDGLGWLAPECWVRWGQVSASALPICSESLIPDWFAPLSALLEAASRASRARTATFSEVTAIWESGGRSASELTLAPFQDPIDRYADSPWLGLRRTSGFADVLEDAHDHLALFLHDADPNIRRRSFTFLDSTDPPSNKFAADLAIEACGSNKQVRKAALDLLDRRYDPHTVRRELRAVADHSSVGPRKIALELMWDRATETDRRDLIKRARGDRAKSLRALAERWAAPKQDAIPADHIAVASTVPPAQAYSLDITRTDAARFAATLASAIEERIDARNSGILSWAHNMQIPRPEVAYHLLPPLAEGFARELTEALQSDDLSPIREPRRFEDDLIWPLLGPTAEQSGLGWSVVLRTAHQLGCLGPYDGPMADSIMESLTRLQHHGEPLNLTRLASTLDSLGYPGAATVWQAIRPDYGESGLATGWDRNGVAGFVEAHLQVIVDETLDGNPIDATVVDEFFEAISLLAQVPPTLVDGLYDAALGTGKRLRARARRALHRHPDRLKRAIAGLDARRAALRSSAAEWLATMGDPDAVGPLMSAAERERNARTRVALIDAAAAITPPPPLSDPKQVLLDAARDALAATVDSPLPWSDFDDAPPLRWVSDGPRVPSEVVGWLIAGAIRAKITTPGATLSAHCTAFDPDDRGALAEWLLRRWIKDDLEVDMNEVAQRIGNDLMNMGPFVEETAHAWGVNPERLDKLTGDEVAHLWGTEPSGSAIGLKGVLAVVAACGDGRVVDPAYRYVTTQGGKRLAQSRALVSMLAVVDDPRALQAIVAIANRFSVRTIQQEAQARVDALSAERGWTAEELADRTVPTLGFRDRTELVFDYGSRSFVATLIPGPTLALTADDGRVLRSLPAPRAGDDEERVRTAKRDLADARKQLKDIVNQQTARLYEALCTQHEWQFDHWDRWLRGHPIVGQLAQRLAWTDPASARPTILRPSADGTLLDVRGRPITAPPPDALRLAHRVTTGDQAAESWREHFLLAGIDPLFDQFEASLPSTYGREPTSDAVRDFEGFMIEVQTLRGQLSRRGYQRGQLHDGPSVFEFVKRFPALGWSGWITFSGTDFPIAEDTVAIERLEFHRDGAGESAVRISEVPPVLLAECYNDLRHAVDKSDGFDPDWRSRTQ